MIISGSSNSESKGVNQQQLLCASTPETSEVALINVWGHQCPFHAVTAKGASIKS